MLKILDEKSKRILLKDLDKKSQIGLLRILDEDSKKEVLKILRVKSEEDLLGDFNNENGKDLENMVPPLGEDVEVMITCVSEKGVIGFLAKTSGDCWNKQDWFNSKPLFNSIGDGIQFFNDLFKITSDSNDWEDMLEFDYDIIAGLKISRLRKDRREEDYLTYIFKGDVVLSERGYLKENTFAIVNQGNRGKFGIVFFKNGVWGNIVKDENLLKDMLKALDDCCGKVVEIEVRELRKIGSTASRSLAVIEECK